ncbi:hypothetical protein BZG02_14415 [Labilibaculum filiforme]|uniref:Cell surface protein n=1 Tax=Labilibaculum filiforme TaxID=1940526 RepID=A0A2N3HUV9_9BACT|nr:DUF5074 domain-containing protein [Labilibaculum filiforme]PKQ61817.1 hypothetical protein BZG02_14415 [Labilibaculum filiforme]
MNRFLKFGLGLLIASFVFVSCSDDDNDISKLKGNFVLNEGSTNGSVSLIDEDDQVTLNYFAAANSGISLGQYPQSMAMNGDYIFIVVTTVNGAGYVEVVTATDFKHFATISGFSYPREIAFANGKAYVSNGNGADASYSKQNNEVYIIDLETMTKNGEIAVGAGPEKMIVSGNKLFVVNSGGWSNDDNTVSVIDVDTDKVVETITVKSCPKDMVEDANGDLWVYCSGVPNYDNYPSVSYTNAGISKISGDTYAVSSFDLTNLSSPGIKNIAISKDEKTVYYMSDAVYAMSITATALPTAKFIDATFYGMDVNPQNGNLWLCVGANPGKVIVYSSTAEKLKEFTVGAMPNSTTFSY